MSGGFEQTFGEWEYGVSYSGDPESWRPHREGMTEDDARDWVAQLEFDGFPSGRFVVVRRQVGAWERV